MDACRRKLSLIIFFVALYSAAPAQDRNIKLSDKKLIISTRGIRLDLLLKKITNQTGFVFSYNTRKVKHDLVLDLRPGNYSLLDILSKIKESTDLDYAVAENHIILKSAKASPTPPSVQPDAAVIKNIKKATVTPAPTKTDADKANGTNNQAGKQTKSNGNTFQRTDHVTSAANSPAKNTTAGPIEKASTAITLDRMPTDTLSEKRSRETLVPNTTNDTSIRPPTADTPVAKSTLENDGDSKNHTRSSDGQLATVKPIVKSNPDSLKNIQEKKINDTPPVKKKMRAPQTFQARVGIATDETLYLGPVIQVGIPILYATAGYKTDFKLGLFNYGLGTSFKISNGFRTNVFVSTGNVSRTSQINTIVQRTPRDTSTTIFDSLRVNTITAKSKLLRFGISVEKSLAPKLTLQGGFQFNSLSTNYYVNGAASALGAFGNNADEQTRTLHSPYLIKNSYSSTSSSNVKTWIGIQLTLLYQINFPGKR